MYVIQTPWCFPRLSLVSYKNLHSCKTALTCCLINKLPLYLQPVLWLCALKCYDVGVLICILTYCFKFISGCQRWHWYHPDSTTSQRAILCLSQNHWSAYCKPWEMGKVVYMKAWMCIDMSLMCLLMVCFFWSLINIDLFTRWYKYASLGLTVFGVYLVAKHSVQYILERRRRWELQRR